MSSPRNPALLLALLAPLATAGVTYRMETIAGLPTGGDGGPAALAEFGSPEGLAFDASGNLYVSDALDHRVRRISLAGIVSTVAGTGAPGYEGDSGPASAARLNAPYGLAADPAGNLYIADLGNRRVRRVSPAGVIETLVPDFAFNQPRNLALDAAGNLYVSDFGDHSVYRITPAGVVTRIAGVGSAGAIDGAATVLAASAPLRSPAGLLLDRAGVLYVADSGNHAIRKIRNGWMTTVAAPSGALDTPVGLALDAAGTVCVADKGARAVWRLGGTPARVAGFTAPRDLAFNANGLLFVADSAPALRSSLGAVRLVTASGVVLPYAGDNPFRPSGDGGPALTARFVSPAGLALDAAGNLYIADPGDHRVRRIAGSVVSTVAGIGFAGSGGDDGFATQAQIDEPAAVAVTPTGELWIAELAGRLRRVDAAGIVSTVLDDLNRPAGVAADALGNAWVSDTLHHAVRKVAAGGSVGVVALPAGPAGLLLDPQRGLYIAGQGDDAIYLIAPDGRIETVVAAGLNRPAAVAVDAEGDLFIADTGNRRVVRVDPAGAVSTIAEAGAAGIAVSPDGAVYVADSAAALILKLTPQTVVEPPAVETLAVAAVVHAATLLPGAVAPGGLATFFGTLLADAEVRFDGEPALLLYSSSSQLNLLVPPAVAGRSTTQVEVRTPGASLRLLVPVADANPGLFTVGGGTGQAAALNADGSPNSAANPAQRGSAITVFATGAGKYVPPAATVCGLLAPVLSGSLAGGVLQLELLVPGACPAGDQPVVLLAGDAASPPGVTIALFD